MRIDDVNRHHADLALEAASAYPARLFAPGRVEFDSEDGEHLRLAVANSRPWPGEPFGLEVVVALGPEARGRAHYLRFFGSHRRATFVLRRAAAGFMPLELFLAPQFGEAALVSADDRFVLRLERRGTNFYATHLSIASPTNAWTHERFVREARDEFKLRVRAAFA